MMFIQDVFFTKQLLTAVKFNNDDVYLLLQDVFFTKQLLTAVKFNNDDVYTRCILYKTIVNCC